MKIQTDHILVLGGGFGTRLKSVIPDLPKPLAPICGNPFLQYLLEIWVKHGMRRFTFLLHYQADKMIKFINERSNDILKDCLVDWTIEKEPLGTGGSIAFAVHEKSIKSPFLVANADTWVGGNSLKEVANTPTPAIGIIHQDDASRYGKVIHENSIVKNFEEKKENADSGWINAGIYKLNSDVFRGKTGEFSLEKDIFPELAKKNKLSCVPLDTDFIDIGIPEDYKRFQKWIESGRKSKL